DLDRIELDRSVEEAEEEEEDPPYNETGGLLSMSTQIQPLDFEATEEFLIGRSPDCELMLEHPKISRKHASLKGNLDDGITITDLGSSNGTFIQNKALPHNTPTPVGLNERIVIANLVKCKLHPADWVYGQAILLKKDMDALFDSRS
ncbi:MAG: FHA domain-containing protein, partial [SAR324 cluster bacterium]|nr:FHA domain-containing protein [SAR324 cluster bacterium]